MFRSLSRVTVAVAFILALVLSTVPVQAQPHDLGARLVTSDASWLDSALGWLQGLFDGGETLQTMTAAGGRPISAGTGEAETMSSSCIDPWGVPCLDNP
jgi:hypothetical protein